MFVYYTSYSIRKCAYTSSDPLKETDVCVLSLTHFFFFLFCSNNSCLFTEKNFIYFFYRFFHSKSLTVSSNAAGLFWETSLKKKKKKKQQAIKVEFHIYVQCRDKKLPLTCHLARLRAISFFFLSFLYLVNCVRRVVLKNRLKGRGTGCEGYVALYATSYVQTL